MRYQQFIFDRYKFTPSAKTLELFYSLDDTVEFCETYRFDFDYAAYDFRELDRALQSLFFMAGVSYYKAYLPPEIIVKEGSIDGESADFYAKTWQKGLGEFFYVNHLDPHTTITFPFAPSATYTDATPKEERKGLLIGIGGGKDSLVSVELLRQKFPDSMTWSLNHRSQMTPLIERIGLPHAWVERQWDTKIEELNKQDAMNGHVPISAIFACVGTIVAILTGKRDMIVSNEQSANEPTLEYMGEQINHQYSKTQEFEQDFQKFLGRQFGDSIRYYSSLRPFSELYVASLFARFAFQKYKDVFSSCNRAYTRTSDRMFWCGECSKCAFVFLILTPFIARSEVETLWGGKNLLLDPALEPTYRKLLGIEGDKPLDCIGEIKESRSAMLMAAQVYPELATKYQFDIPADYNYRTIYTDEMPPEIREAFMQAIAS